MVAILFIDIWSPIVQNIDIAEHYKSLLDLHGDSFLSAQYSSAETQDRRLVILTEIADLKGSRVLDFGCGAGRLGELLHDICPSCEYNGADIVQKFHDICSIKFPKGKFDFFDSFHNDTFDYIFISGVFNNKIQDNRNFYRDTIRTLFDKVHKGIAFNMMSSYVDFKDEGLFYESPEEVFTFLKTYISPYVSIRNDYYVKHGTLPFDFTVYVYKEAL